MKGYLTDYPDRVEILELIRMTNQIDKFHENRVKYIDLALANYAYLHFTKKFTYEKDTITFDDDIYLDRNTRNMILQLDNGKVCNIYLHLFKEIPDLKAIGDGLETVFFKKDTSSFPTPENYFALRELQERYPDLKYANLETGEIYRRSDEYYM